MVHPIQDGQIRLDRREGEDTGSPGKTTETAVAIAGGNRVHRSSRIGRSRAPFSTGPVWIEPGRNRDLTWHEDGVRGELGQVCGFERRTTLHCKVRRGLERDSKREKENRKARRLRRHDAKLGDLHTASIERRYGGIEGDGGA